MKQEYNRLFDKITSDRSDEQLLEGVLRKAENMEKKAKFNKKAILIPVAAALTLTIGGVGFAAAMNSGLISQMFGDNESIAEDIQTYIYEDSNDNLKMTVEEFLTDGQSTFMTVHYKALTDEGKAWLDSFDPEAYGYPHDHFSIQPVIAEYKWAVNYCSGCDELQQQATDTDRWFYLHFDASSREYGGTAKFNYPMGHDAVRSTKFNTESNVDITLFELKGEGSPSEHFIPKYLSLSEFNYAIYAENISVYRDLSHGSFVGQCVILSDEDQKEFDELVQNIRLVMKDGSKYLLDWSNGGTATTAKPENNNTDLILISGSMLKPYYLASTNDFVYTFDDINAEDVAGVEIGDCYYDLVVVE